MKIYTYFEDFAKQNELLELWKLSWEKEGFEVGVLGLEDAKKSKDYDVFCEQMRSIVKIITGKELSPYGLSCFVRWLAYSTVEDKDSRFFVSDFDVINSGKWKTWHPITNKLHFYDLACPCLASGNPKEFKKLCDAFFNVTMSRISRLKHEANHYHDQNFFIHNFLINNNPDAEQLRIKYNMFFSRRRCEDVAPFGTDCDDKVRAFHVSHENADHIKIANPEEYQNLNDYESRIKIIRNILNLT